MTSPTPTVPTAEERARHVSSWLQQSGVTLTHIDLTWQEFEDEISEIILEAEKRGAERMRERAAERVEAIKAVGVCSEGGFVERTMKRISVAIRALPLTEDTKP